MTGQPYAAFDSLLLFALQRHTGRLASGERRAAERKLQHVIRQKELLVEEMQHRFANSLQIIASILLLKARTVQSGRKQAFVRPLKKDV